MAIDTYVLSNAMALTGVNTPWHGDTRPAEAGESTFEAATRALEHTLTTRGWMPQDRRFSDGKKVLRHFKPQGFSHRWLEVSAVDGGKESPAISIRIDGSHKDFGDVTNEGSVTLDISNGAVPSVESITMQVGTMSMSLKRRSGHRSELGINEFMRKNPGFKRHVLKPALEAAYRALAFV